MTQSLSTQRPAEPKSSDEATPARSSEPSSSPAATAAQPAPRRILTCAELDLLA